VSPLEERVAERRLIGGTGRGKGGVAVAMAGRARDAPGPRGAGKTRRRLAGERSGGARPGRGYAGGEGMGKVERGRSET